MNRSQFIRRSKKNEPDSLYMIGLLKTNVFESEANDLCIWCKKPNRKNKAHIFSTKIIKTNKPLNYLKRSVCEKCNSFFGNEIEDWFYKYSPIGTWAHQFFDPKGTIIKQLKFVPNFVWIENLRNWVVIHHDQSSEIYAAQLILGVDGKLFLFYHSTNTEKMEQKFVEPIFEDFQDRVISGDYTEYITDHLPENFQPRVVIFKDKLILIAHDERRKDEFVNKCQRNDIPETPEYTYVTPPIEIFKELVIHYNWSVKRYNKLCAKIGFEFLCLFHDAKFCNLPQFDSFKKQIIKSERYDKNIVPFYDGKGYKVKRFTAPGWVSYVKLNPFITGFPALSSPKQGCHKIFIHAVHGYLLVNVILFNLEPCQLVLAKGVELDDIMYIEYDYMNDLLEFYSAPKSATQLQPPEAYNKVKQAIQEDEKIATVLFYDTTPPSALL